jgi:SAM-dependent methyltransferase
MRTIRAVAKGVHAVTSTLTDAETNALLRHDGFPLASKYDARWILENQMGPNALWLSEWLCQELKLQPGMRVLDLGCGRAISSIFLAREYGVQVWAANHWESTSDNWQRIRDARVADRVFPIKAEARSLPFAHGFFDAIACVDSFIYFGTDDLYLDYLAKFVVPDGRIGIVNGGLTRDFDGPVPQHLCPFWGQDCWGWHPCAFWRQLWERTGLVDVEVCDMLPHANPTYVQWKKARLAFTGARVLGGDAEERARQQELASIRADIGVLEADAGEYLTFVRMVGRRL